VGDSESPDERLTIAELAALTGLAQATLRAWERRHGTPAPQRLANGHRRYSRSDVETINAACELRRAGLSVGAALRLARSAATQPDAASEPVSIFAILREARPELPVAAMDPWLLARISHAVEDECLARASPGLLIGAFQREPIYRRAQERWRELAASMRATIVLADFSRVSVLPHGPSEVPLPAHSPMAREWALIAPPGCVVGRERTPDERGQGGRMFDAIWSPEPEVIYHAARMALRLVDDEALARRANEALGPAPPPSSPELRRAAALTNRMLGYVGAKADG
jgi:MerR family transcriptional regulator, light-induced transcriptional regulator